MGETVEILMDAAIYNEVDYMRSVSENIIFGQIPPIVTGVMDIHMDDTRTVMPNGRLGPCMLDDAAPMLPQTKQSERLFSMADEASSSPDIMPPGQRTPYVDEVKDDFA